MLQNVELDQLSRNAGAVEYFASIDSRNTAPVVEKIVFYISESELAELIVSIAL